MLWTLVLTGAWATAPVLVSTADAWRVVRVRPDPTVADADGTELGGDLAVTTDADGDGEPELWISAPRADTTEIDTGFVTRIPAHAIVAAVGGVVDEADHPRAWGMPFGSGVYGGRLRRAASHFGPRPIDPHTCHEDACIDDDLDGDGLSDLLLAWRSGLSHVHLVRGGPDPWGPDRAVFEAVSLVEAGASLGQRFGQALTLCDLDRDGRAEPWISDSRMEADPCGAVDGFEAGAVFRWPTPDPRPGAIARVCTPAVPLQAWGETRDGLGHELTCLRGPAGDQLVATTELSCAIPGCTRTLYAAAWSSPAATGASGRDAPARVTLTATGGPLSALVVGTAADLDGDGQDDLLLGVPEWTCPGICAGTDCGAVAVHFGGVDPGVADAVADADVLVCGTVPRRSFGRALSAGGDLNGDGLADWVVGASDQDYDGPPGGLVYVVLGGALAGRGGAVSIDALATHRLALEVDGAPERGSRFGRTVELTDLDLDGYADVLIGARGLPDEETGAPGRGGAFIVFGAPDLDRDGWFGGGAGADCDDTDPTVGPHADPCHRVGPVDADGDGYAAGLGDCDDADPGVHPGALELPDGVNQDCDARIDEGTLAYDDDRDGLSEVAGDCDDADPTRTPGRSDPCDGVDQDCDGVVDEDGWQRLYADTDADGHGDALTSQDACPTPAGYVARAGDCDDGDPTRHPGAVERAWDGVDQDCDGVDFVDADGDGFAGGDGPDCDDADPRRYPGSTERPWDTADLDCDGHRDVVHVGWCATGPATAPSAWWALLLLSAAARGRGAGRS